ncbi:peptidylprolyl isomerase [Candidatus Woesearchaeota archaeon]|nr:peptidylprolyl isomerase [Candidatus Woesearchaeota archaeon]
MTKLKKGDFIELEYTGKLAQGDIVFDTTDEEVAKQHGLHDKNAKYGAVTICIGENHVLKGLDKALVDKELGKDYSVKIAAEDGFGRKQANLLKLVPAKIFAEQKVQVQPGLQVNIDGVIGTIIKASGGRVIVDFNHPLASKELVYDFKVDKCVTDAKEKVTALVKILLNMDCKVQIAEDKASVELDFELPENVAKELEAKIVKLAGVKAVSFKTKPKPNPTANKNN